MLSTQDSRQSKLKGSIEKKRKDYAFRRQFDEKPSLILGCPGAHMPNTSTNRMIVRFTKSYLYVLGERQNKIYYLF